MQQPQNQIHSIKVDQELVTHPVYRALHETIYFLRFLWFRLTEVDILVSAGVGLLLWAIVQQTGNQRMEIFGLFRFDPWGWLGAIVLTGTIISIFHKLRPEGDIDKVIRNWFQKHQFAATAAVRDKLWKPSKHYR